MKQFWKDLLNNVISGAAATAGEAAASKADIKGVGSAALAGAVAAILQTLISHPVTAHPAVAPAVAAVAAKAA